MILIQVTPVVEKNHIFHLLKHRCEKLVLPVILSCSWLQNDVIKVFDDHKARAGHNSFDFLTQIVQVFHVLVMEIFKLFRIQGPREFLFLHCLPEGVMVRAVEVVDLLRGGPGLDDFKGFIECSLKSSRS